MIPVFDRLLVRYRELEDVCYRMRVAGRDGRGRFGRSHRGRAPRDTLLLKKVDLDEALLQVYRRFFGAE